MSKKALLRALQSQDARQGLVEFFGEDAFQRLADEVKAEQETQETDKWSKARQAPAARHNTKGIDPAVSRRRSALLPSDE